MPEPSCHLHEAPDAATLAEDLARFVAQRLQEGLSQRGQALLVVSGGTTPVPFFEALSQSGLDWARVSITLADERWVPPDHADSNERLVRAHLLKGPAAAARFAPLKSDHASATQGLPSVAAAMEALPWPADVVVLGMGSDAHTASLFPGSPELAVALDDTWPARCLAVSAPAAPNVPVDRVSLSRRALLDSRHLVVHVTGAAKRLVLDEAMQPGPVEAMPIRLALHLKGKPCEVFYSA
ncbi:MAG: 6-phosphogluconolactonase [Rubrivivax sp.]|nr:MAG: 6-phosphogluconolactonase [Rubrivivax sp.]